MEQQELLDQFNGLLDNYRKHRQYIERVELQSDKFSPAVIERVKLDHEVKSSAVAEEILPLVPGLTELGQLLVVPLLLPLVSDEVSREPAREVGRLVGRPWDRSHAHVALLERTWLLI